MNEQERRAQARQRFDRRCGYCGVHETETGSELEIDHFQPRSKGGEDDPDNLVYWHDGLGAQIFAVGSTLILATICLWGTSVGDTRHE